MSSLYKKQGIVTKKLVVGKEINLSKEDKNQVNVSKYESRSTLPKSINLYI